MSIIKDTRTGRHARIPKVRRTRQNVLAFSQTCCTVLSVLYCTVPYCTERVHVRAFGPLCVCVPADLSSTPNADASKYMVDNKNWWWIQLTIEENEPWNCIHKTSVQKTHFLTEHYCINFWSSASSSDATLNCTSWYNKLLILAIFAGANLQNCTSDEVTRPQIHRSIQIHSAGARPHLPQHLTYLPGNLPGADKNPVPVGDLEGCRTSIQKEPHLHTVYLLQMLLERVNFGVWNPL